MNDELRVGQRVEFISRYNGHPVSYGETGTIRDISLRAEPPIGVEWDGYNPERHNLAHCPTYSCEKGHGWYVYADEIEIIPISALNIKELI